jgi:uncharacterized protein YajQ (UPF0234 family)
MPSFDIVSEIDLHEVRNAVDQAAREVGTRFDFKDASPELELADDIITLSARAEFNVQQIREVLYGKLAKRGVDLGSVQSQPIQRSGSHARQTVKLIQGVDAELAKKIVRLIKDAKLKVQASIQGDKVRVSGKKRDDLQECIATLRAAKLEQPLQFNNFRD